MIFEIYQAKNGEHGWKLKHNSQTIAAPKEKYKDKASCLRAVTKIIAGHPYAITYAPTPKPKKKAKRK